MILENAQKVMQIDRFKKVGLNAYRDNNLYYFKDLAYDDQIVSELLGSYISRYFNLPTISYKIAKLNNDYGLLSADLVKQQTLFKDYKYWNNYYTELFEFLIKVKQNFHNPILYQQFMALAMQNILMNEEDCNMRNVLFTGHNESDLKLIGVLDFEKCHLTENDNSWYFSLGNHFFEIDIRKLPNIMETFPELENIFQKFLNFKIEYFLNRVEKDYDISIPLEIKNSSISYVDNIHSYVKKKL